MHDIGGCKARQPCTDDDDVRGLSQMPLSLVDTTNAVCHCHLDRRSHHHTTLQMVDALITPAVAAPYSRSDV
jgi:hypothetical protein